MPTKGLKILACYTYFCRVSLLTAALTHTADKLSVKIWTSRIFFRRRLIGTDAVPRQCNADGAGSGLKASESLDQCRCEIIWISNGENWPSRKQVHIWNYMCCMLVMGYRFPWPQYDNYGFLWCPWGWYIFVGPLQWWHGQIPPNRLYLPMAISSHLWISTNSMEKQAVLHSCANAAR